MLDETSREYNFAHILTPVFQITPLISYRNLNSRKKDTKTFQLLYIGLTHTIVETVNKLTFNYPPFHI